MKTTQSSVTSLRFHVCYVTSIDNIAFVVVFSNKLISKLCEFIQLSRIIEITINFISSIYWYGIYWFVWWNEILIKLSEVFHCNIWFLHKSCKNQCRNLPCTAEIVSLNQITEKVVSERTDSSDSASINGILPQSYIYPVKVIGLSFQIRSNVQKHIHL